MARLRNWHTQCGISHILLSFFIIESAISALFYKIHERLSFDAENLIGYSVAMTAQYIFVFNAMITLKCLALFGAGTCFMLFPLAKDIKCSLKSINDNARHKIKRTKIVTQLSQFVEFHSKLLQLSHRVNF